jgi:outer membrane protein OmpA-like peptidoglycan-associated protein
MHDAPSVIGGGLVLGLVIAGCPPQRGDEPASSRTVGEESVVASDGDADGVDDAHDRCAEAREDLDGFEDDDGCPDVDSDPQTILSCDDADDDGIDDARDRCPSARETFDAHDDEDGCPDLPEGASLLEARRVGDVIHLEPPIRFELDDDELLPASAPSLDALASLLAHQPRLERVQLRVHIDPPAETRSRVLSRERAQALVGALAARGIARDRLEPRSYEGNEPLVLASRDLARTANRRIEVIVVAHDARCDEAPTCPPDADRDGVADASDACPAERESFDGVRDDDGCPDDAPRWVVRRGMRLVLGEPPSFEAGTATLRARALPQLEVLASYLVAHPELRLLEVQGHAEDRREAPAIPLDQARAHAIVEALVSHGVTASRLHARGYGDSQPIEAAHTRAARRANARIELVIRDELPPCLGAATSR